MSEFSYRKTVQIDHSEAPVRQRHSSIVPADGLLTNNDVCAWNGVILKVGMKVTVSVQGNVVSASIFCINSSLQLEVSDAEGNKYTVLVSDIISVE